MNLNEVHICGRITQDLEVKTTKTGLEVLTFSVATNMKYKDKKETEFHNVVAFGKLAGIISQYFDKGDEIFVRGRLKTDKWKATDGSNRSATRIMADKIDFGQKSQRRGAQQATGGNKQADEPVIEEEINLEDIQL